MNWATIAVATSLGDGEPAGKCVDFAVAGRSESLGFARPAGARTEAAPESDSSLASGLASCSEIAAVCAKVTEACADWVFAGCSVSAMARLAESTRGRFPFKNDETVGSLVATVCELPAATIGGASSSAKLLRAATICCQFDRKLCGAAIPADVELPLSPVVLAPFPPTRPNAADPPTAPIAPHVPSPGAFPTTISKLAASVTREERAESVPKEADSG